jgi:hypothetical protein
MEHLVTPIEQAEAAWRRYDPENEWEAHLVDALTALLAEHKRVLAEMHQRELHHFETEQMLTEAGIDLDAEQSATSTDQDERLRREFEYRIRTAVAFGIGRGKPDDDMSRQQKADWIQHEIDAAMKSNAVVVRTPAERSDDYEAGYTEGFHDGLSTPRGSAEDDRAEHPEPPVPARELRECTICGEKVTVSNATEAWEKRHEHPEPPSDAGYWVQQREAERDRADAAESKLARIAGVLDDDERSSVILAVIRGIIYDDKETDRG